MLLVNFNNFPIGLQKMPFHKFPNLPPEIRAHILEDAMYQEAEGRLLLLHRRTGRIVPTKNNISPLFAVNIEARRAEPPGHSTTYVFPFSNYIPPALQNL